MWDEPRPTQPGGLRANSYVVTARTGGGFRSSPNEGIYAHIETGSNLLYCLILISHPDFFWKWPIWEHPDRPGEWGPYVRVTIQPQHGTGLRPDGIPLRPLSNNSVYSGLHRMPVRTHRPGAL